MRTSLFILALSGLLGACSQARDVGDGNGPGTVASIKQNAQFADDTMINLVDPGHDTNVLLTSGSLPVVVDVFYLSGKTTDTGSDPGTVTLAQTISLGANETARHKVNTKDPAFAGGYGAIFLNTESGGPSDLFQTYAQYSGCMFSTGGTVFMGSSYRVPYWDKSTKMVLVVTNQADFTFDVQISNVGTLEQKTVTLPPLSTYRFDSADEGFTLNGTNSIQILTSDGGLIALSGFVDRVGGRIRITPVKAAPYAI